MRVKGTGNGIISQNMELQHLCGTKPTLHWDTRQLSELLTAMRVTMFCDAISGGYYVYSRKKRTRWQVGRNRVLPGFLRLPLSVDSRAGRDTPVLDRARSWEQDAAKACDVSLLFLADTSAVNSVTRRHGC
jgi:hypothetical protein